MLRRNSKQNTELVFGSEVVFGSCDVIYLRVNTFGADNTFCLGFFNGGSWTFWYSTASKNALFTQHIWTPSKWICIVAAKWIFLSSTIIHLSTALKCLLFQIFISLPVIIYKHFSFRVDLLLYTNGFFPRVDISKQIYLFTSFIRTFIKHSLEILQNFQLSKFFPIKKFIRFSMCEEEKRFWVKS